MNGFGMGAVFFVLFGAYALAFWYGSTLVLTADYSPGSMMIVSSRTVNINQQGYVIKVSVMRAGETINTIQLKVIVCRHAVEACRKRFRYGLSLNLYIDLSP